MQGEKATRFKAQYLHGMYGCKCGRHKQEGDASYPVIKLVPHVKR